MTNSREKFEALISGPPYELDVDRFGDTSAWPGNYKDIGVDLAWQAFKAGRESMREELENFQPAKEDDLPAILRRQAT